MLKLMTIRRGYATTQRIVNVETTFNDFIELVSYENFGKDITYSRQFKTVYVAKTGTTYNLLEIDNATESF